MTEDRKYAILFAATLLCARKLIELDSDLPLRRVTRSLEESFDEAVRRLEKLGVKRSSR